MNKIFINQIIELVSPEKIILFGSLAKGNVTKESDYDLLVLIKSVLNKRLVTQQLYKELVPFKIAVYLIVDTPENYEKYKKEKSFIYYQIDKTGKIIYDKSTQCTDLD